jgi:predicted CopG family antitoxin
MTKTISVTDEAYEALIREKRNGESFTDVIIRLTRNRAKLSNFAGIWKDIPAGELKEAEEKLKALWTSFAEEVKAYK